MTDPQDAVLARVSTLTAAESRPKLTAQEVKLSVQAHPMPDRYGVLADDPAWEPTWDTNAAVAELWGIKAGKVAGDFTFSADGSNYAKGDVMAHCLAMETKYAAMVLGASSTAGPDRADLRGVVVNG